MFCGFCGSKLDPGATFCGECGQKVENYVMSPKGIKVGPASGGVSSSSGTTGTLKGIKPSPVITANNEKVKVPEVVQKTKALPKIERNQIINFVFMFALFIVYAMCTFAFMFALNYEEGIVITSGFNSGVNKYLSLSEILNYMYNGYTNFEPTVSSTLISVLVYTLMYSLPLITLIMFVGIIKGNSKKIWHTSLSILNIISAAVLIAIMPLVLHFVPNIKNVIGAEVSIITEDIAKISYVRPIVFAIVIVALVIISYILLFLLLRRKKNEKNYTHIK